MSHTQSDDSPDDEAVFPFLIDSLDDRGQHNFCNTILVQTNSYICLNQESAHVKQNSQM